MKINKEQKELVFVNLETGDITVAERFEMLHESIQKFVLISVNQLHKKVKAKGKISKADYINADNKALIDCVMIYPDAGISFFQRELEALFTLEELASYRYQRIENIKAFKSAGKL